MSSIRYIRLAAIVALAAGGLHAQSVLVSVQAASSKVLVNGTAQVSAAITAIDGTPLDSGTLAWSSSDSTIANVSATGLVTGLTPGDVQIGVTDANTGVAASLQLHVAAPSSLTLQVSTTAFAVGGTAQLTPSALDAAGKAIPNLRFQFRSGQSSVATVSSDGVVTGIAEGQVSIEAGIAGVASNPALVAGVTPAAEFFLWPRYKIRKIISTDVATDTTIAAVSTLSAANSSEVGAIVTLGNGGQAAVLLEGAKTKVIAAPPGSPSLHVAGWCCISTAFPRTRQRRCRPAHRVSVAMVPRRRLPLSPRPARCFELGSATIATTDSRRTGPRRRRQRPLPHETIRILSASATAPPAMLFSLATQPTLKEPMRSVDNFYGRRGSIHRRRNADFRRNRLPLVGWQGIHAEVYHSGDPVRNAPSFSIDVPVGSAAADCFTRAPI